MTEQEIIARYFFRELSSNYIAQSIGDDAAIVNIPPGQQLVMSMDTLNANVHFPYSSTSLSIEGKSAWHTSAFDIGYKAVAVNLSDLAAMGAQPIWVTLSLSLPELDTAWLEQFSQGLYSLLDKHQVSLIGGDLNHGPLSITIQAEGLVPSGKALLRSGAQAGDLVYVSGELGTAAYVLQQLKASDADKIDESHLCKLLPALTQPQPQISLGLALQGIASSCLDLSDGLLHDIQRIMKASQVGMTLDVQTLPVAQIIRKMVSLKEMARLALVGGDDYQLCFTIPATKKAELITIGKKLQVSLTEIGLVTESQQLELRHNPLENKTSLNGFEHFHKNNC